MSEDQTPKVEESTEPKKDSFDMPVEKSPWLVYALLQIPIVAIMLIVLYFMYQSRQN